MRPLEYFSRLQTLQPMRPVSSKGLSLSLDDEKTIPFFISLPTLYILTSSHFLPLSRILFLFFFFLLSYPFARIRNHPPSPATIYGDAGNFSNFRIAYAQSRFTPIIIRIYERSEWPDIDKASWKGRERVLLVRLDSSWITSHESRPFFAKCPIDLRG